MNSKLTVKAVKQPEEALALTNIEQIASNVIRVAFNKDVRETVTKDKVAIKTTDGTVELSIKSVEFSADGTAADITVFNNFVNEKEYKVTADTLERTFKASVGDVASIAILTASAEKDVATDIKFVLKDANGVDVTPSINLDTTCIVEVEGSYSTAEIARASEAKITQTTVGDVATVKVTYNSNKAGAQDVVQSAEIRCVAATAKVGSVLFTQSGDINTDNECAKFYQGLGDKEVKVGNNGGTAKVYFCATKDGSVLV